MTSRTNTQSGILIAAVAMLSLSFTACNKPATDEDGVQEAGSTTAAAASESGREVRVQVETVETSDFHETVSITGNVEAVDDALLSARAGGTVVSLVPLGRRVLRGATIASIDPGLAKASVAQAEASRDAAQAQFALAEDTYNRQEPLYRDSVISSIEFQQVKAQMNSAKAQLSASEATLQQVQEQLSYTRVTAPFAGTIEEHMAEMGEQVAPGMQVARIVNSRRVRVAGGIPERYAGDIKMGAAATVKLDSYGLGQRDGKVTFVGSAINVDNRTFPIEIELYNSDGELKPEMIATVEVTRRTISDALVIRQSAILRDETGNSVYVVDRSGGVPTAARKTITTGASNSGMVVVTEGLSMGDELITVGQSNVAPGDRLVIESDNVSQATR